MQIGVVFPTTEIGTDPAVIKDFVQAAEGLGYSHILAFDHVLGAVHEGREPKLTGPYTERTPFHEPLTFFAYVAGITSRIGLVTGVVVLPQRQTALVAKQAAQVQILSGGRLRLGIGTGWNPVEFEALGERYSVRGRRTEEQVEVLRKLWAEPVVDYTGRYHRIDRAGLNPAVTHPIPIWFGGRSEAGWRRAARIGDGVLINGTPAYGIATLANVRRYLAEAGRDPATFGIEGRVQYGAPDTHPDRWRADRDLWRAEGAGYIAVHTMDCGLPTPRAHIEAIERYAAGVLG